MMHKVTINRFLEDSMINHCEKNRLKAIILCGGEGKRLRPLTSCVPKPLLTVNGTEVLKNILKLLSRYNIHEAAITLGYRGDMIKEAFGDAFLDVSLTYFEEKEPLGSAGGVKKAANFINGHDFIVICGDAWCDFNLGDAYSFFNQNDCDALILTDHKPSSPLEYGIVISQGEHSGKVTTFVEKPSWSGVCSSRVNTGIYIFKNKILELIPEGKSDFGFDLFTKMPQSGMGVYCWDIDGYWQDIGTLEDYYNCNLKASGGKSIIGNDCIIAADSSITKSVILDAVRVGHFCNIDSAVIGIGAIIGEEVTIEEGAVIGPYCVLGDKCTVKKGVTISEGQVIKSGEVLENPLYKNDFFVEKGIKIQNNENTVYLLGVIIGNAFSKKHIGVMYAEAFENPIVSRILMLGLSSTDAVISDLGKGFLSLCSFAAHSEGFDLTVFVRQESGGVFLGFFDKNGSYPGAAFESLIRHSSASISSQNIPKYHPLKIHSGIKDKYIKTLTDLVEYSLKGISFTFYTEGIFGNTIRECIRIMGGREISSGGDFIISSKQDSPFLDIIYDGIFFDFDHIKAVCILAYAQNGIKEISLSYRTNEKLKELVKKCGIRLCLYAETGYDKSENARRTNISQTPALYDGGTALMLFINYVLRNRITGKDLMDKLPEFKTSSKHLFVPEKTKQMVAYSGVIYDKEGFIIKKEHGYVRIIPENGKNICLCAEAATIEDAEVLIKSAEEFVNKFKNQ